MKLRLLSTKTLPLLFLPFLLVMQACDKNDPAPAPGSNEQINSWIYDNMQYWYYWSAELPTDPDKSPDPEPFFESLKNSEDRFSWIQKTSQSCSIASAA